MRTKSATMLLSCAAVLAASQAASAHEVGRWYATGEVGALFTDDDRNARSSDRLFGLSIGKHLSESWSLEFNANGVKLGTFDPYAASIDALRVFRRDRALALFLTMGAGAIRNDAGMGNDSTDAMAQAGAGLLWQLGENRRKTGTFSLRPEIKARWDDSGREDFVDYIANLGFQFSFGAPPAVAAPEPAVSAPPAPAPAPVAKGPEDSDNDEVLDESDRCPGTAAGVAVDVTGCPQQGAIVLAGVTFENDSATLAALSSSTLDRVAADLKRHQRLEIELQGHTDSVGSGQYNLRLSQQRADSVRAYLVSRGVPASQVVARGYGEARPRRGQRHGRRPSAESARRHVRGTQPR